MSIRDEQINIHAAKTHLSRLVERAAAGEEIVIAKAGAPMARLVPYRHELRPRRPGALAGKVWMSDDFDAPDDEVVRAFEADG